MKVLTKASIKKSEENAVQSGAFSFRSLMFSAGKTAAEIIMDKTNCISRKVAVICGNGNNGGDGFVIAQTLYEHGADVSVILPMGKPVTENADYYYNMLHDGISITENIQNNYDIIIDAVFGIGLNRDLNEDMINFIEKLNGLNAEKIAIDIPSGVETDSGKVLGAAFIADYTVTFIAYKPCFFLPCGSDYCGEVIVADIGAKPVCSDYETLEKPVFQKRKHNSHKGTFGTALLMCGSYGMAGAAILAAKGALRSGVGIVKSVLCDGIYSPFTAAVPEAVCVPLKQSEEGTLSADEVDILKISSGCNALLFGCGIKVSEDTRLILKDIILKGKIPIVLDADGINCLSLSIELLKESQVPLIITPHPGEMARLCNRSVAEIESNRIEIASDFAKKYGCTVVLKGADTIVATQNGEIFFNPTGNPGMACGGSGDVLAGMIVSLLAQGYSPEFAAKSAVFLHGEAGDKAALRRSQNAMIPSDIIEEL